MKRFEKKPARLPLRHDVIITLIASLVIRAILRYAIMALYLIACEQLGLYNHGLIAKIVVTLTSICLSRWILREIGRAIYGDGIDEPMFETVGIVSCVRNIKRLIERW